MSIRKRFPILLLTLAVAGVIAPPRTPLMPPHPREEHLARQAA